MLELVLSLGLEPEHFYLPSTQLIFRRILDLGSANGAGSTSFDIVTLKDALTQRRELTKAGGAENISTLIDGVAPERGLVANYVKIIKRDAGRRKFLNDLENARVRALAGDTETAKAELAANLTQDTPRVAEVIADFSSQDGNKPDSDQEEPEKGLQCPTIKRECWHGISAGYLEAVQDSTEAPDSFHHLSFLVAAGAGLGKYVSFPQSKIIYPNLWGVLVGVSSKARKGTAMSYAMTLLREACGDQVEPLTSIDSWEGIVEILSQARAKNADTSHLIQLEEMRSLLELSSQKGMGKLIPKLCELYDCINPVRKATAHDSRVIDPPPAASFLAGTTKAWMRKLTAEEIEGGLGNRLCFVAGEKKKILDAENPPRPKADVWASVVRCFQDALSFWKEKALQTRERTTQLSFTPDAKKTWREFYNDDLERRGQDDPLIDVLSGRDHLHTIKANLVFAGLDQSIQITRRHLDAAIAFSNLSWKAGTTSFGDSGSRSGSNRK